MEEIKMNSNRLIIWGGFIAASVILSFLLGLILTWINLPSNIIIVVAFVFFLALIGTTLVKGFFETPEKNEDIVESLGEYVGRPYKAGPHLIFPYFNLEKIRARVFMGEQKLGLYLDDATDSGDVEFQDSSASLWAYFFFKINDSVKATYEVGDVLDSIREKAEHVLRSFFGVYKLDEAIALKGFFKLENVLSLIDKSDDSPEKVKLSAEEFKNLKANLDDVKNSNFFLSLEKWGVEPKSFIISDIEVPEEIKVQRARVLTAEKDKEVAAIQIEVAKNDATIKVIKAKADAKQAGISGQGEAERLKKLTESGIDDQAAIDYLINKEKWNAVSVNPNATVIVGDGSKSSEGAQIGAGIGAVTKKSK